LPNNGPANTNGLGQSHFVHLNSAYQYLTQKSFFQFKPDIIIVEIVERNLELLPDYFSNFVPE
jgi:hypothetical protein